MHQTPRVFVLSAIILFTAGAAPAFAGPPKDACSVLSSADVSAALGAEAGNGTYVMPNFKETCTWTLASGGTVTLELQTLTFFNAGKGGLASMERTPAGGIGDEAYYIGVGPTVALAVKRGDGAFKVAVYSRSLGLAERKEFEKVLAEKAISKF
jgi:hypothetical protein